MHRTLALATLALLAGCRDAAPKAPPTDDATYARLAALGGDALVVGLVDPRQWSALRARVAQLSPPIASALPEAPRAAAQALGLTAEEAAAWDPERPIVVSAFEGSALVAPGGVGADLPLRAPTGARHQAVIPATDPAALAAGLRRLARLHGDGEGDAVRLQAPGQPRLRFLPEDGAVRVVAEVGTPGPARPAPAAPTPALRALADGRPAVGALLRPGLLNDVMTRHSLSQVAEALEYAPPEFRDRLLARGLAEVVLGNLLMAAASPDVEDVSLALAVEGEALSLLGVASLTPAGAARLQKGTASAGRRLAPKPGLFAWASVAFDLAAAVADAPTLPYATADELARGVMGCGVGCTLALPLRMPFTLARALVDAGPVPRADLPRAWQVAVGSGGPRPLALAVDVAAGFDPAPLKLPPAALERVARGDRATLLLSMDLAARDAFDLEATAPDDRLGEVTLARLPGWLPLPGALGRRVTLSGRVDGAALLARLQLAPADAAPTPLAAPASQAWTPATLPTSPGAPCLAKVARASPTR
ncbi:MAG: hypothetical protein H6706_24760 [Myxococcales bacterium]|nr:hypothetical protein [Myxococcales bacterium]